MTQKDSSTLAYLAIGTTAKIVSVDESGAISRRLLEMGVVPGATVRVVKTAAFGCPMEIRVRNSHLALRRVEANSIVVE